MMNNFFFEWVNIHVFDYWICYVCSRFLQAIAHFADQETSRNGARPRQIAVGFYQSLSSLATSQWLALSLIYCQF